MNKKLLLLSFFPLVGSILGSIYVSSHSWELEATAPFYCSSMDFTFTTGSRTLVRTNRGVDRYCVLQNMTNDCSCLDNSLIKERWRTL